jgi:hypothetical protein
VAAELVRLETLAADGPAALRAILRRLGTRLQGPRYASLRRALMVWLARVLLRRLLPGENFPQLHDFGEVETMLSEHVDEWTQKWKREGKRAGKLEGKSDALKRLLRVRSLEVAHGSPPAWTSPHIFGSRARLSTERSSKVLRNIIRNFQCSILPLGKHLPYV